MKWNSSCTLWTADNKQGHSYRVEKSWINSKEQTKSETIQYVNLLPSTSFAFTENTLIGDRTNPMLCLKSNCEANSLLVTRKTTLPLNVIDNTTLPHSSFGVLVYHVLQILTLHEQEAKRSTVHWLRSCMVWHCSDCTLYAFVSAMLWTPQTTAVWGCLTWFENNQFF